MTSTASIHSDNQVSDADNDDGIEPSIAAVIATIIVLVVGLIAAAVGVYIWRKNHKPQAQPIIPDSKLDRRMTESIEKVNF